MFCCINTHTCLLNVLWESVTSTEHYRKTQPTHSTHQTEQLNFHWNSAAVIYALASELSGWLAEFFPYKFLWLDLWCKHDTTRTNLILTHGLAIPLTHPWGNTAAPQLWGTTKKPLGNVLTELKNYCRRFKDYFPPSLVNLTYGVLIGKLHKSILVG